MLRKPNFSSCECNVNIDLPCELCRIKRSKECQCERITQTGGEEGIATCLGCKKAIFYLVDSSTGIKVSKEVFLRAHEPKVPKECPIKGCSEMYIDGTCCSGHRCGIATTLCIAPKSDDSLMCKIHTCTIRGCFNSTCKGTLCVGHVCERSRCNDVRNGLHYCETHKCQIPECEEFARTCPEHTCHSSKCWGLKEDGFDFCSDHLCSEEGCNKQKTCRVGGVNGNRRTGVCSDHNNSG